MKRLRSIEVRVGALLVVALALLAAFIAVMGGLSFEPTYTVYVSFNNPGGLQSGAPVRISGVQVGRVSELVFRGGLKNPETGRPEPVIRAVTQIERRYRDAIRQNSRWFVTSQGMLGEMFLAVEPGSPERPALAEGAVVQGISPPRLDLLLSESYELLHGAYVGFTNNETKIAETLDGLHRTLRVTGRLLEQNEPKLNSAVDDFGALGKDAREAVKAARDRYVDGPQVTRIMNDVERTAASVGQGLGPLMTDGRELMADGKKLVGALSTDEQLARYRALTTDLAAAAQHANTASRKAEVLVGRVERGQGTLGALIADEAAYDDLQELLRDLKHNPWKFFWRQ